MRLVVFSGAQVTHRSLMTGTGSWVWARRGSRGTPSDLLRTRDPCRQPPLALAVLAQRPGEIVTMAEIAEGMFKLGGLRKRPVAPDAKDLRYKTLRPIKKTLNGNCSVHELDRLVETVRGGLRLNV
jgi:hypothetical protein